MFRGILKFLGIYLEEVWVNSLRISGISLKFGGMMHSTMKQIAIENGYARPFFVHSTEL